MSNNNQSWHLGYTSMDLYNMKMMMGMGWLNSIINWSNRNSI